MNLKDKIKVLQKKAEQDYRFDVTFCDYNWKSGEIEKLQEDWPTLSETYVEFIECFDSPGISWFVFYGSSASEIISIEEELEYWEELSKGNYFPFGKDPAGSIFTFNKNGNVIYFDIDDYEWENPTLIADSFDEFLGECLLGNRYGEFDSTVDNDFYDFIKSQGWAD